MRFVKRIFFSVTLIGLVIFVYSLWRRSDYYEIQIQLDLTDSFISTTPPQKVFVSAEPYTSVDMRGWMEFKHKIVHFESRNELIHLPNDNPVTNRCVTDGKHTLIRSLACNCKR